PVRSRQGAPGGGPAQRPDRPRTRRARADAVGELGRALLPLCAVPAPRPGPARGAVSRGDAHEGAVPDGGGVRPREPPAPGLGAVVVVKFRPATAPSPPHRRSAPWWIRR